MPRPGTAFDLAAMEDFHPTECQAWEIVNRGELNTLYHTATWRCGCGDFDNSSRPSSKGSRSWMYCHRTLFSRVVLPVVLVLGGLAMRMTLDGHREDYAAPWLMAVGARTAAQDVQPSDKELPCHIVREIRR